MHCGYWTDQLSWDKSGNLITAQVIRKMSFPANHLTGARNAVFPTNCSASTSSKLDLTAAKSHYKTRNLHITLRREISTEWIVVSGKCIRCTHATEERSSRLDGNVTFHNVHQVLFHQRWYRVNPASCAPHTYNEMTRQFWFRQDCQRIPANFFDTSVTLSLMLILQSTIKKTTTTQLTDTAEKSLSRIYVSVLGIAYLQTDSHDYNAMQSTLLKTKMLKNQKITKSLTKN